MINMETLVCLRIECMCVLGVIFLVIFRIFLGMPKIICPQNCMACFDQGDSEVTSLQFGTYSLPVLPWNCKQKHSIYLVECNICERRPSDQRSQVYDGHSKNQVNWRIGKHYNNKRLERSDKLDQHFLIDHPNVPMKNNVTVFLISDPILDKNQREGREQVIRREIALGEAAAGITKTCLLNVNMTPMC